MGGGEGVYKRFIILLLTYEVKVPLEWKLITAPPVQFRFTTHVNTLLPVYLTSSGVWEGRPKKKHLGCCAHGDEPDCGKVQGLSAPTKQLISSEVLKTKALDNSFS